MTLQISTSQFPTRPVRHLADTQSGSDWTFCGSSPVVALPIGCTHQAGLERPHTSPRIGLLNGMPLHQTDYPLKGNFSSFLRVSRGYTKIPIPNKTSIPRSSAMDLAPKSALWNWPGSKPICQSTATSPSAHAVSGGVSAKTMAPCPPIAASNDLPRVQ